MKTYQDLSDELQRIAPRFHSYFTKTNIDEATTTAHGMLCIEDKIVEAMQEAFTAGRAFGDTEGRAASPVRERIRAEAGEQIAAAGREYERKYQAAQHDLQMARDRLAYVNQQLAEARDDAADDDSDDDDEDVTAPIDRGEVCRLLGRFWLGDQTAGVELLGLLS